MEDNKQYNEGNYEGNRESGNEQPETENSAQYSFPVDLNREEYVRFNLVVSQTTGMMRTRKGQMLLFAVLSAFSLIDVFVDAISYKTIDPVMIILVLFFAAFGSLSYFGMPLYVRRAAERAYDQSIMNGHSYYGQIHLHPDYLEKQGANATTRLSLNAQMLYIEAKDCMIFLSPNSPAIVLPARCLTAGDADTVRRMVLTAIPASHQKVIDRMIPKAAEHIAEPAAAEDEPQETEQMHLDVTYTQEEFIKLATDTAGRGFMRALPVYSSFSVLAALLLSFLYNFGVGITAFILIIGALFAFNVISVRAKASQAYRQVPESRTRIGISFTDKGITIQSQTSRESIGMIWESIVRAVERRECVEFYTQSAFLRIPKHCIGDIGLLKQIVDSHIRPASK